MNEIGKQMLLSSAKDNLLTVGQLSRLRKTVAINKIEDVPCRRHL